MRTILFTLFISVILLATNLVQAEPKALLRLNLQKGTTYEMTMTTNIHVDQEMMGQKMKVGQKMEMIVSYKVLDVLANKNFLIEYLIKKISIEMNMNGKEMNFDSESTDSSNPMNTSFKNLVANSLKIELDQKGQVERVEGLEEYTKKLSQNPQMAQAMQVFTDTASFNSFIGQIFSYFPESEVSKGDKWTSSLKLPALMNTETIMNFEVIDIKADMIDLNVTSAVNLDAPIEQEGIKVNMKMTGTQNGTMTIDATDGWVRSSNLDQKFNMDMKMKNRQSGEDMEIPVILNSVTKITVIKK